MNNSYTQPTLFDMEPYSANPEPESVHPTSRRTASITVYLTPEEKARLEEYASREGKTMSDKIREAIKPWIQSCN